MPENKGTDTSLHDAGTRKGEEMKKSDEKESGRHDEGETGAGRPTGSSTARDSTGINAEKEDPIDPSSPKLPPA